MKKLTWLRQGINVYTLAEELNSTPSYIYGILSKQIKPSIKRAFEIQRLTEGKIKATDLRPDIKDIVKMVKEVEETGKKEKNEKKSKEPG
jgi:DNA-binding transcriptional regulator YdaS (Cro superfamily)